MCKWQELGAPVLTRWSEAQQQMTRAIPRCGWRMRWRPCLRCRVAAVACARARQRVPRQRARAGPPRRRTLYQHQYLYTYKYVSIYNYFYNHGTDARGIKQGNHSNAPPKSLVFTNDKKLGSPSHCKPSVSLSTQHRPSDVCPPFPVAKRASSSEGERAQSLRIASAWPLIKHNQSQNRCLRCFRSDPPSRNF